MKYTVVVFPLVISACGIMVCMLTSFVATHIIRTRELTQIEPSLKRQLIISTVIMTPILWALCDIFLPANIEKIGGRENVKNWAVFVSGAAGLWSGLAIGLITEYYTSYSWG